MAAGESAGTQAQSARAAAERLANKSRYAAKKADDYEKGAVGEAMVATALEPLVASGWRVLHDRVAPDGGNIDHIAIGPPGVAVLDAKNWAAAVTITPDRRLVASKYDHTKDLTRLAALAHHVRDLAARDGVNVSVRGYLVLTGELDRDRESASVGDLRILGVDRLVGRLSKVKGDLAGDLVDAIAHTLDTAFPPAGNGAAAARLRTLPPPPTTAIVDWGPPSPLFERAHRFYYLSPWRKAGHHRLYLKDRAGTSLGWTDVNTGATTIDCTGDEAKFATTLLAAADPTGMKLAPGDLPKVATRLWGGRLLSKIARSHTSVLVGQEWRAFGKQRLYCTLIDPSVSTFHLGHVDLKTGERHPATEGDLAEYRGPADRYISYLQHQFPHRAKP